MRKLWTPTLLATITAMIALPAAASAGTYTVVACDDATALNGAALASVGENNSWETYFSNDSSNLVQVGSLGGNCQSTADPYVGLGIRTNWAGGTAPAINGDGYWQFDAPSGTSITNVNISRFLGRFGDLQWIPYVAADGTRIEECTTGSGCSDSNTTSGDVANGSVQVGLACDESIPVCDVGATRPAGWAVIYGSSITLSESVSPSLTVNSDDVPDSGYADSSTKSVFYGATDLRGIKSARLELNGSSVDSNPYSCDYTQLSPCSNISSQTLDVDLGAQPEGSYTANMVVVDGANNETSQSVGSFTIDHTAPAAPNLVVAAGSSNTNNFALTWLNPTGQVAPITKAYYKICSSTGSCGSIQSATGSDITRIENVQVPSTGTWTAQVWLEDEAGNVNTAATGSGQVVYDPSASTTTASTISTTTPSTDTQPVSTASTTTAPPTTSTTTKTTVKKLGKVSLKITSARLTKTKRLKVIGTCSKAVRGKRLTVIYKPKRGGKSLKKTALCTKGKWSTAFKRGKRSGGKTTASYRPTTGKKATATKQLKN